MLIDCEVIPRARSRPDQLRALGNALLRWYVRECREDGIAHSLDTDALIELLNGRPPLSRAARLCAGSLDDDIHGPEAVGLGGYEMPLPNVARLLVALGEAGTGVASFRVRASNYDRGRTIASLRRYIQADHVEDVLIDGRSWGLSV